MCARKSAQNVVFLAIARDSCLARRARGDILALAAGLSTGDVHAAPGPVAAGIVTTEDIHIYGVGFR